MAKVKNFVCEYGDLQMTHLVRRDQGQVKSAFVHFKQK
jgi:hypothetical protein